MSLRSFGERVLHASGAIDAIRFRRRRRLRILMYHRFAGPPDDVRARLKWQCGHLRRYFHPVSLSEVAHIWKSGGQLPANALAITVDDGYGDFSVAAPVFQSFGLKVTIFVVSGFLDRELWLWTDRVKYLFAQTTVPNVEIAGASYDLATVKSRNRSEDRLEQIMIRMSDTERRRTLENLPRILRTALPSRLPEQYAPLSWDELKALQRAGIEVGAHTKTHPILSRLEGTEQIRDEVQGSKNRVEAALDAPVLHFCYPNGTKEDYDKRSVDCVRECGFETAVTTTEALNERGADLFQLSRIGVGPETPPAYFERVVAGYRL
ncbi:MAG: polysaccharide deacetylase family protein [Acidobacteriota bacterium]|nr:polysaccharide deacetylase family protein [Acidobacteriota bacterium]